MAFVKANHINFYYEQFGKGEDILLISGLSADHKAWAAIAPKLADNYRVTIFDNRGVGQSDVPEGNYTVEMMAEDTSELMEALEINSAHVIGHSMGGMIAGQLALKYPHKVKSLGIVCSKALPYARCNKWLEIVGVMFKSGIDMSLMADYSFSYLFGDRYVSDPNNAKNWLELIKMNPHPQTLEGFERQFYATKTYNAIDNLDKIKIRTLIMAGEDDLLTPVHLSEAIHNTILDSELTILPSGHMPNIECPELLTKTIFDWVGKRV